MLNTIDYFWLLFDIVSVGSICNCNDFSSCLPNAFNLKEHELSVLQEFSMKKFRTTCHLQFITRWTWAYVKQRNLSTALKVLTVLGVAGFALSFAVINKLRG